VADRDALDLEAGAALFAREPHFVLGVARLDQAPPADRPEVAFAGRSNVGKSSLLNALVNRRSLARASGEPGRTRELNFFALGPGLYLVDLPGYGFAKASAGDIRRWTALTRDYLRGRVSLKRVFLLIDARHGLKSTDLQVMETLDRAASVYQIVLTKTDKVKPSALAGVAAATAAAISRRPGAFPRIAAVSSHTGSGIDVLRAEIAALAA
jgi:GTP-binding protein